MHQPGPPPYHYDPSFGPPQHPQMGPGPMGPGPGPMGPGPGPMGPGPGPLGPPPGGHWPPAPTPAGTGATTVTVICRIAAVSLIALGLSIPFDDTCGWVSYTAWSIFALAAAIGQLLPQFSRAFGWTTTTGWLVGAVSSGLLLGFWVLIALPGITSNAGFCLTLGTAAAVGACWLAPGRRW